MVPLCDLCDYWVLSSLSFQHMAYPVAGEIFAVASPQFRISSHFPFLQREVVLVIPRLIGQEHWFNKLIHAIKHRGSFRMLPGLIGTFA